MPNSIPDLRQKLANFAVIMNMANNPKISSLFSATNARIYQAFQGIDALINNNCGTLKDSNNQPFAATWASAYSTWMTDKIAGQNQMITSTISVMSAAIPTANVAGQNAQQAASIAAQSTFISNFNDAFPINSLTFPAPGSWPNNPLVIQKRQACSLSQPSTNPTASATDATSQGTVSTGGNPSSTITPPPTLPLSSNTLSRPSSQSSANSISASSSPASLMVSSPAVPSPASSFQSASES